MLAQVPETTDSLGAALSRAHRTWTKQAAGGETTVLAYDRGVTALVGRAMELRATLVEAQVRTRELAAATRALHSVPADDLSGVGKVRHFERIADAEAAEQKARAEVVQRCRDAGRARRSRGRQDRHALDGGSGVWSRCRHQRTLLERGGRAGDVRGAAGRGEARRERHEHALLAHLVTTSSASSPRHQGRSPVEAPACG